MGKQDFEGKKTWSNYYWFYYKWHIIAFVFFLTTIIICTAQCSAKVETDYYVLFYSDNYYMDEYLDGICDKLEEHGEDLSGDGEVRVTAVNCTYNMNDTNTYNAAHQKAVMQMQPGNATIWVLDTAGVSLYYKDDNNIDIFASDKRLDLYENHGISANKLKCISEINDNNINKEFQVFFRKDSSGKIDKNTSELLNKILE